MPFGNFKIFCFLIILLNNDCFSKEKFSTLETKIYEKIDYLVENPSEKKIKELSIFIIENEPKAITLAEKTAFLILYCNKGYNENQLNLKENAIKSYENGYLICQKNIIKNYDFIEYCYKPLGTLYTQLGYYQQAENCIKTYYLIALKNNNSTLLNSALQNLSLVYFYSSQIEKALAIAKDLAENSILKNPEKAKIYLNLSNYFISLSYFSSAEKMALQALKLNPEPSNMCLAFENLATLYLQNNNVEKVEFYLKECKKISKSTTKFLFLEAQLLHKKGQLNQSEKLVNKIIKNIIPKFNTNSTLENNFKLLYADSELIKVFELKSNLAEQNNQYIKSIYYINLALHIQNLLISNVTHEESKIILQSKSKRLIEQNLINFEKLYLKTNQVKYIEEAFLFVEKNKSKILFLNVTNIKSKTTLKLEKQIAQNQNIIEIEKLKYENVSLEKLNTLINIQNSLYILLQKEKALSNELQKNDIKINDVYKYCKSNNQCIVSYFYGVNFLFQFQVSNKSIKYNKIMATNSIKKVAHYLSYFSNSNKISEQPMLFFKDSNNLFTTLKVPKNKKKLIILTDGLLQFLPFDSLITQPFSRLSFSKAPFLVNNTEVSFNFSIDFLFIKPTKNRLNKKYSITGFFPEFKNSNLMLHYSKDELNSIQKNFKGVIFQGAKANFKNYVQSTPSDIIHLCTHANSGTANESAAIQFADKNVRYHEICSVHKNPKLVILSACETGLGKFYSGESAFSVARGFYISGTKALLFSLWKVNDFSTSKIMSFWYSNLKKGKAFANCTQSAKIDYLQDKSISEIKKSPYYWASFVYYGQNFKNENSLIWVNSCIVILFFILIVLINKKAHL